VRTSNDSLIANVELREHEGKLLWSDLRNYPSIRLEGLHDIDRLCGLVVRIPSHRPRGHGFDSRRCQVFCDVVGLEEGPLSLVRINEELLERRNNGSGLEN
jgi:hypothetical protein